MVRGKVRRNRERLTARGLNDNHNHDLKNLFKGAAISASTRPGPLYDFYVGLLEKGMRPAMARLTLARRVCHHHFNDMEERSEFRRPTIKSASSLSISAEQAFPSPVILSGGRRSGSGDARFEGEYQSMSSAPCASAPSHPLHVMPPRITRNSDRPRASDRTMVDTEDTRTRLPMFPDSTGVVTLSRGTPQGWKTNQEQNLSSESGGTLTAVGWPSRQKSSRPPVEAELFFLTSLFIEHVMPPRITRNSDRPRVLWIEPWWTRKTPGLACQCFPSDLTGVVTLSRGTPQGWKTNQSKTSRANRGAYLQQWAGRRDKTLLALRSRRNFFFTSLFIELIEGWRFGLGAPFPGQ